MKKVETQRTAETLIAGKILAAVRAGNTTRKQLMAIEHIRHLTWAVVATHLKAFVKQGVLKETKTEWKVV